MTRLGALRRRAETAALLGFRRLPGRVQRSLVRAGTPSYTVGAVCLIEHDGEVLLLWQPHRRGWSLPGGLLERGETPHEAVAREVSEEVGLRIDPGDVCAVRVYAATQQVDVIYRVQVDERPTLRLATEARKAQWCAPQELTETDGDTRAILETVRSRDDEPSVGRLLEEETS